MPHHFKRSCCFSIIRVTFFVMNLIFKKYKKAYLCVLAQ